MNNQTPIFWMLVGVFSLSLTFSRPAKLTDFCLISINVAQSRIELIQNSKLMGCGVCWVLLLLQRLATITKPVVRKWAIILQAKEDTLYTPTRAALILMPPLGKQINQSNKELPPGIH